MSFRNLFILSVVLVLLTVFCSAKPKPKPNCFPCKPLSPVPQLPLYPQYSQYPQYPVGYGANFYPDNGQQVVGMGFAPPVQQVQPQFQQLQQLPVQQVAVQQQPQQMQIQPVPVQMPVPQFEYQPQPQPQPVQYNQMGLVNAPCNQQKK